MNSTCSTDYVLFGEWRDQGPEPWAWTRLFTEPGWRHCLLVRSQEGGSIVLNPMSHHLSVRAYPDPAVVVACALGRTATAVLRVHARHDRVYNPRGLHTCVSVVKHAIGVRAYLAWTPKQLHQHLIAQGAEDFSRCVLQPTPSIGSRPTAWSWWPRRRTSTPAR